MAPRSNLLKMRIESDPPGATIQIDGQANPLLAPADTVLGKGSHRIVASLAGHEQVTLTINLAKSGQLVLLRLPRAAPPPIVATVVAQPSPPAQKPELEPEPLPLIIEVDRPMEAPKPVVASPSVPAVQLQNAVEKNRSSGRPGRAFLITGGVLGGVGLIGVVIGGTLFGVAKADQSRFAASTDEFVKVDILNRFSVLDTASVTSYALGGIFLAGGVALLSVGIYQASHHRDRAHQARLTVSLGR